MFRLVLLSSCLASIAFAQVVVTGKNGKTVKIGTGGGVDVQSGNKQVKVKTGAAGDDVEVSAKNDGASGTVKCGRAGTQSLPEIDVLAIRPRS